MDFGWMTSSGETLERLRSGHVPVKRNFYGPEWFHELTALCVIDIAAVSLGSSCLHQQLYRWRHHKEQHSLRLRREL